MTTANEEVKIMEFEGKWFAREKAIWFVLIDDDWLIIEQQEELQ